MSSDNKMSRVLIRVDSDTYYELKRGALDNILQELSSVSISELDENSAQSYHPTFGFWVTFAPAAAYIGKKAVDILGELLRKWLLSKSTDTEVVLYGPDHEVVKLVKVKNDIHVHRGPQ